MVDPQRLSRHQPLLRQGDMLQDRFVIEGVLANSSTVSTYVARHQFLADKVVAIKEMRIQIDDPARLNRAIVQFEREARLLTSLEHPGLVKALDYFKGREAQYLVMDYVEGQSLDKMLKAPPRFLDIDTVLAWADQLCDVLDYLHDRQPPILCRDLKPANIVVDASGKLRLIDLGMARTLCPDSATFFQNSGSMGYAAPEHFSDVPDPRSDIYSLGATLYCLLTNDAPPPSLMRAKGRDSLVPPMDINPEVSESVNFAIVHMLALLPGQRPPNVAQARSELHKVAPVDTTPARPPGWVFEDRSSQTITMRTTLSDTPRTVTTAKKPRKISPGALVLPILAMVVGLGVIFTALKMKDVGRPGPSTSSSAAFGTLRVTTTPPDCTVLLDGTEVGKAPLDLPNVPLGPHHVRLTHAGYNLRDLPVSVIAGPPVVVRQALQRAPVATATPLEVKPSKHPLLTAVALVPVDAPSNIDELMHVPLRNSLDRDGFGQVDVTLVRGDPSDPTAKGLMEQLKVSPEGLPILALVARMNDPEHLVMRGTLRDVLARAQEMKTDHNLMLTVLGTATQTSSMVPEAISKRSTAGFDAETLPIVVVDPDLQRSGPILQRLGLTRAELPCIVLARSDGGVLTSTGSRDGDAVMSQLEGAVRTYRVIHK